MAVAATHDGVAAPAPTTARKTPSPYSNWFYLPAAVIYGTLFLLPTLASLFFSLTRWTLFKAEFIGLDNFIQFFREPFLYQGLINTLIYGVMTSGLKVVLGMMLALLLTSDVFGRGYLRLVVFFPTLVSTVGVGITFTVLMNRSTASSTRASRCSASPDRAG